MFEGDDNIFPNKPELVVKDQRTGWTKTLLSMLLFIAVFLLFFSENYILILEVTGILLLHELGHFIMMKKYGYKSLNMLFIPLFGAMVNGEKAQITQGQKFWISLMGPLPGLVMGTVGFLYYLNNPESILLLEASALLIFINALNLIPLDPLDGGHIIETLFFPANRRGKMIFTLVSSLILIGVGFYFEVYIIMIFGFLMSLKVRGFQKSQRIQEDLDEINFNYKRSYQDLSNKEYWTIRRIFLDNNPKIKEIIPDDLALWENETLIVDQVRQILQVDIKKDLSRVQQFFFFTLFVIAMVIPAYLLVDNADLIITTFWGQ